MARKHWDLDWVPDYRNLVVDRQTREEDKRFDLEVVEVEDNPVEVEEVLAVAAVAAAVAEDADRDCYSCTYSAGEYSIDC